MEMGISEMDKLASVINAIESLFSEGMLDDSVKIELLDTDALSFILKYEGIIFSYYKDHITITTECDIQDWTPGFLSWMLKVLKRLFRAMNDFFNTNVLVFTKGDHSVYNPTAIHQ